MVPRSEVVALSTGDEFPDTLRRMRAHPYDRYPLLDSGWENLFGTLYMKTVFRHLPELPVSDLIDRLQKKQQEIAIVQSNGRVRGFVTSTDAFEAIAGELEDPRDVVRQKQNEAASGTLASSASGGAAR